MKLLFDQNLSHRLVAALADTFPGSSHGRDFDLERADDATVWEFAKSNGYTIISKDNDFHQRSFLYGHPPKVVCSPPQKRGTAALGCIRRSPEPLSTLQ